MYGSRTGSKAMPIENDGNCLPYLRESNAHRFWPNVVPYLCESNAHPHFKTLNNKKIVCRLM